MVFSPEGKGTCPDSVWCPLGYGGPSLNYPLAAPWWGESLGKRACPSGALQTAGYLGRELAPKGKDVWASGPCPRLCCVSKSLCAQLCALFLLHQLPCLRPLGKVRNCRKQDVICTALPSIGSGAVLSQSCFRLVCPQAR